jgi:hypothetical protein
MIEAFFSMFQNSAVHKIALLTGVCSQVIRTLEQEFSKDKNGKDAAIDTLITLLTQYKNANDKVELTPPGDVPCNPGH